MKKVLYLSMALGVALVLQSGQAGAQALRDRSSRAAGVLSVPGAEDPADSLYRTARSAMSAGNYRKAATLFKQLVDRYPKSKNTADALYWRAYSLYQSGTSDRSARDYGDALAALETYTTVAGTNPPQANEVADLRTRIRAAQAKLGNAEAAGDIAESAKGLAQARACSTSSVDEETRVAALEGLLNMNSDDALPILKDVLKQRDQCRVELRKKAVWLISQKQSPDVVTTLLDVARNDPSTEVRKSAVFALSQTQSDKVVPALDSILFSPGDEEVRKQAVFALAQQNHDAKAAQVLRRAVDDDRLSTELRGQAIFWLGDSPSNANLDYFKTAFRKYANPDLRSKIVQAVSNTPTPEAAAWLLDVARDKSFDVETRKSALFWAGQRKTLDFDQVAKLYADAKGDDPEIRKQVLFVYSQRSEAAALDKLMAVAKSDSDIEMRKSALFWIGQKNDPRAKKFILDILRTP